MKYLCSCVSFERNGHASRLSKFIGTSIASLQYFDITIPSSVVSYFRAFGSPSAGTLFAFSAIFAPVDSIILRYTYQIVSRIRASRHDGAIRNISLRNFNLDDRFALFKNNIKENNVVYFELNISWKMSPPFGTFEIFCFWKKKETFEPTQGERVILSREKWTLKPSRLDFTVLKKLLEKVSCE